MSIATDIVGSSIKVYEAALEDKARTTVVETVKLGTGIVASTFTAALIVGLATGGTGLIVIGIVAAGAAIAAKGTSEIAGHYAGKSYDLVEKVMENK
ncbi:MULTISPECIES: hypothetical protein [unclassified Acinetobacter]|uniref:hypothetical protein n=1 Tax=unclassified Acinetobacter TaxID=196816 RepID=UPI00211EB681|nr:MULTISPECIES: hypothetical protein [unclassified Acinetobacter]